MKADKKRIFFILLSFLPLGVTACVTGRWAFRVPYQDEWGLLPLVTKAYAGGLTFMDFWAPHNEHRMVFSRAILVGLARLTRWDLRWEPPLNLLTAFAAWGLYLGFIRNRKHDFHPTARLWLPFGTSVLTFSLVQWVNWVWGFELAFFLAMFVMVAGLAVMTRETQSRKTFIEALSAGVIASFTFTPALVYWVTGLFILLVHPAFRPGVRTKTLVWVLIAAAVIFLHLHGNARAGNNHAWANLIGRRKALIYHIFIFLGTPMVGRGVYAGGSLYAFRAGIAGAVFQAILLVWLARRTPAGTWLFPASLCLTAVGMACLIGLGRVQISWQQAIATRYTTLSYIFWISALLTAALCLKHTAAGSAASRGAALFLWAYFSAVIFFGGYASYRSYVPLRQEGMLVEKAAASLDGSYSENDLKILFPWKPYLIPGWNAELKAGRLSIYAGKEG